MQSPASSSGAVQAHGFLLIDKPVGITSSKALSVIKRAVKPRKVGHAGTLDPLASGLLPVAIGEATKALRFITEADKTYEFTIRWGERRATDDAEGEVVDSSPVRPGWNDIERILPDFTGTVSQIPPDFSAIKVGGKRAYALARSGQELELRPRDVRIDRFELLEADTDTARFAIDCGKGTYVRALARDIAEALGTFGYISALRRTKVGRFSVDDAFLLEKIEKSAISGDIDACLLPLISVLDDIPALQVGQAVATRLRRGQSLSVQDPDLLASRIGDFIISHKQTLKANKPFSVCSYGKVVAVCELDYPRIKTLRVFNE